ncbi:MAG TPA: transporter substrate-binding domain-containing protein [Candidatus Hydrogenedentes bacterium]|nr:transporter substrate-binding domain-containing protein [Candidatus Hydrogenedentota bacterium]
MKIHLNCIAVFIMMLFPPNLLSAAEKCEIYWLHPEQPPFIITKGYGTGMGIMDRTEKFLVQHLKDCVHTFESANYERIIRTIKSRDNACGIPLYRTPERDQFVEFSVPYRVAIPNAVITLNTSRKKLAPYINDKGYITLEDMIVAGYHIGIAQGRVYRSIIDETLAKYKNDPRIVVQPNAENMVDSLVKMMLQGKIDALIAYPWEGQYVAKTMNIKIISIPVAGMDDYGLSMMGCAKTRKGREIIRRVNEIILKYRTSPEFMDFAEHWLDPSAIERYRMFTRKEFGTD